MNIQVQRLKALDDITAQYKEAFQHLNHIELNWRREPSTWSIAQILEHLIIINNSYFPIVESLHAGTYEVPFISRISFVVKFLGNKILKAVSPDSEQKITTFPIWQPSYSSIPDGIVERFLDHQAELKQVIIGAEDLMKSGAVISSPANRNIVYTLERAFDILVMHEKRHFVQAHEVYDLMKEDMKY